jgi:hypothetical protein
MELGKQREKIALDGGDKVLMSEALRSHNREVLAAALETTGHIEIPFKPVAFIMESVRSLAESGRRPDAQALSDTFDQIAAII